MTLQNERASSEELAGQTLTTYLDVLKKGPVKPEEIQRSLGFQSPSQVYYHLGKLAGTGFVVKDAEGRYVVSQEAANAVLTGYYKLGAQVVPQLSFFAVLFSILVGYFSVEFWLNPNFAPYLVGVAVGAVVALWYQTARLWKKLVPKV